jgi:hypothetical protein
MTPHDPNPKGGAMKRTKLGIGASVVAVVSAALAIGVSVIAVGSGGAKAADTPTPAIGPVSSSQAGGLDAATRAGIQALNKHDVGAAVLGQRLIADARTLPTKVDGYQIYLVPTATGKLCLGLGLALEAWFDPLSQTHPVLFGARDNDGPGGVGPTVYGVAVDGVSSVTFTIDGARQTVPVAGNVFVFHGPSDANFESLAPVAATFADGTVQALK